MHIKLYKYTFILYTKLKLQNKCSKMFNNGGGKMKFTIEQARLINDITQGEMAKKLSMSEKTYIQYEKYRRVFRMDTAAQFMKVVKLSVNDIIFFRN